MDLTTTAHATLLHRLQALAIGHLLHFRVEVGRAVIEELGPDGPTPDVRAFANQHRESLAELGLSEGLLRQCVRAHQVLSALPEPVRPALRLSQVVELGRVDDPAARAPLAQMAVDEGWSTRELRAAVDRVRAGMWVDASPAPGLQPEPPPAPAAEAEPPRVLAGHLVSKIERRTGDVREQLGLIERIDPTKLSAPHRERLGRALDELEADLRAARARIGG
jgi:predicted component of type VI protein secretion system